MRTKLIIAASAVLLAACGKSEPPAPAAANAPASQPLTAPGKVTPGTALKIKGFYIGMDIHDVPDTMMDLLGNQGLDGYGFTDVIRYSNGEHCVLLYDKQFLGAIEARMTERYDAQRAKGKVEDELQSSCYASDGVLVVKAGADGRVRSIEFNNAGELFDARKMQPDEFAKKLVGEYRIPALKPNDDHSGWRYVAPDGTRLEILVKQVFGIPVTRLVMSRPDA
ncbi:MAG: hypothetical protein GC139_09470 [Sideroxydans sp.]|nr:hypothetical protein [Sideroxydans sp.]